MYPYLFNNKHLPTYGILFFLGIISSFLVSLFTSKKSNLNKYDMMYASAFALCGGIIGAKTLFLISSLKFLLDNHIPFLVAFKSGFVFYGCFLGGALGYYIYCKIYKLDVICFYDRAVVCLPLGQFIGRIGCFCAGCCYGKPTNSFLGVIYKNPIDPNVPIGVKLLPTQLFEAVFCFFLFVLLLIINNKKTKKGTKMLIYIFSYSVFRFINEIFRYDSIRGNTGVLSTSQIISLFLFCFAAFYYIYFYKHDYVSIFK